MDALDAAGVKVGTVSHSVPHLAYLYGSDAKPVVMKRSIKFNCVALDKTCGLLVLRGLKTWVDDASTTTELIVSPQKKKEELDVSSVLMNELSGMANVKRLMVEKLNPLELYHDDGMECAQASLSKLWKLWYNAWERNPASPGLQKMQVERDEINHAAVLEAPACMPVDLAKMRPKLFLDDILTPRLARVRLFFSSDDVASIDQDHRDLVKAYKDEPGIKAIIDAHSNKTNFNDGWNSFDRARFSQLHRLCWEKIIFEQTMDYFRARLWDGAF
ncbi:hypothetical protein B5M09_014011 [Aphanomyces astaci]|uniref:Uncharacterized protein n=1 Tax=Aphanomyces astaci TaxID=112090 RepID=A0A3R7WT80_APHAT|nr:hypothetical protein B5M09_014011 [Aphanomyces astaci]